MNLPKAAKYLITTVCVASFSVNLVIKSRTRRRQSGSNKSTCQLLNDYKSKCNCNDIAF